MTAKEDKREITGLTVLMSCLSWTLVFVLISLFILQCNGWFEEGGTDPHIKETYNMTVEQYTAEHRGRAIARRAMIEYLYQTRQIPPGGLSMDARLYNSIEDSIRADYGK